MSEHERATEASPGTVDTAGAEAGWSEAFVQLAAVSSDIGQLVLLELRLTLATLRRMLLLAVLCLPLLLLIWLTLSALPALGLYQASGSLVLAALLFLAVQVLAFVLLWLTWQRYRRTLGLPRTRHQLDQLLSETGSESPTTH